MITTQERQALISAINSAIETVNRMKKVIANISEKRYAVEQIIITQNSIETAAASEQVSKLINLTDRLDAFVAKIIPIKDISENIPDVFKIFIQKEIVLFAWNDLYLTTEYATDTLISLLKKQGVNETSISDHDSSFVGWLCDLPRKYPEHTALLERKISTYEKQ